MAALVKPPIMARDGPLPRCRCRTHCSHVQPSTEGVTGSSLLPRVGGWVLTATCACSVDATVGAVGPAWALQSPTVAARVASGIRCRWLQVALPRLVVVVVVRCRHLPDAAAAPLPGRVPTPHGH